MPTYEYRCKNCKLEFEVFQSISAPALTVLPEGISCLKPNCQTDIQRVISKGGGVILRGTGFYETDYVRKNNDSAENVKETKTANSLSSDKESKTEKKEKSSDPKGIEAA